MQQINSYEVNKMTNILIDEQVDIYQLPAVDVEHELVQGAHITIGDLHANTMKLIFMLVKHGIAKNITAEDYQHLVAIYKIPTRQLSQGDLRRFNQLLEKIEFNNRAMIRLIGDELADRGNNDYFTLKVLKKLHQHQVPVEIIVSNHGIEFIEAYEKQDNFHAPMLSLYGHAPSMENLETLINNGVVTRAEILKIAQNVYNPKLRAISYSLSEDPSEITIYSHAGIGLNTIQDVADKLGVLYNDASAKELALTIHNINEKFLEHVRDNTVHTLYTRQEMFKGYQANVSSDAPFAFIMWNRNYDNIHRPSSQLGYNINFVHGHDSNDKTQDNIYNLDNPLGKLEYMNRGSYTVLYSQSAGMSQSLGLIASPELNKFTTALRAMKEKAKELRDTAEALYDKALPAEEQARGYTRYINAADAADALCTSIGLGSTAFLKDRDVNAFKWIANEAIKTARNSELKNHRGYAKEILGYAGLAVLAILTLATVGVAYAVAGAFNYGINGHFFFSTTFNTNSINKVNELEMASNALVPSV